MEEGSVGGTMSAGSTEGEGVPDYVQVHTLCQN